MAKATIHHTLYREVGDTEHEITVECHVYSGSPGGRWEPPTPGEIEVVNATDEQGQPVKLTAAEIDAIEHDPDLFEEAADQCAPHY